MLFMYKRPGQRVNLNAAGHMMVRPTHMEASVQKSMGGKYSFHCRLGSTTFDRVKQVPVNVQQKVFFGNCPSWFANVASDASKH